MCTGLELLAGAAVASSLAGTGLSIASQQQQGKAAQAQADYSARVQENEAAAAQDAAQAQAEKIRLEGKRIAGQARAALAGSGVDVNTGSSLEAQRQIGLNAEQDALSTILTGQRQSNSLNQQAGLTRASGANARAAANIGSASSLVGGLGKAASGWQVAAGSGQQKTYDNSFDNPADYG